MAFNPFLNSVSLCFYGSLNISSCVVRSYMEVIFYQRSVKLSKFMANEG